MNYIKDLTHTKSNASLGNKAYQLKYLMERRFPIPQTYICLADLHRVYQKDKTQAVSILKDELHSIRPGENVFAVRSSANIEDGMVHSFAGQFESILDVKGIDNLTKAVIEVWESANSESVNRYIKDSGIQDARIEMSVIIQEMIQPKNSGVVFSRNPTTGLDEVIIEAVAGRGDLLVQQGMTPDRWIYKWGDWIERPQAEGIETPVLDNIVEKTQTIAKSFGRPVDLEWVFDGEQVFWVQLRGQTERDEINIYSNRISREFMPGTIKPLLWSVSIPLVNTVWVDMFSELIGDNDIDPLTLAKSFYGRSYFNMGVIGNILESLGMERETLEIMIGIEGGASQRPSFRPGKGVIRHIPRMFRFISDKLRFSRKVDVFLEDSGKRFAELGAVDLTGLSEMDLLNHYERVFAQTQETAYFNVVVPLLMQFHFSRLRRKLGKYGIDFDDHNLTGGAEALEFYDPGPTIRRLNNMYRALDTAIQAEIAAGDYQALKENARAEEFHDSFEKFLDRFGHLGESGNDFTASAWETNPDLALKMVVTFPEENNAKEKRTFNELRVSPLQRLLLTSLVKRAQQFRIYREAIGFTYTYGYSLFRKVFLELGERFVKRQLISVVTDIFYLTREEIHEIVLDKNANPAKDTIRVRQEEQASYKDVYLPSIIFGDQQPPLLDKEGQSSVMVGTATSRGYYQGKVRVIRSLENFDKLQTGEVLVVPFSDIGWTPIFSKAGAVIAESGGILSHSSIVAREYGIPAVVSVENACDIPDGTEVIVDGYKGQVYLNNLPSQT